jgi:hypothetical protein
MKKIFKAWIIYEGKTLILKREKEAIRESIYIVAENEEQAREKFSNTIDYDIMIKNRGRITNTGEVHCPRIKVEKSYVKFSTDFPGLTIKDLSNVLSADDFLEYCQDKLTIEDIVGL